MAGRRYDEAQRDVLKRLAEAHETEMVARATLRRKIEEAYQEQLAGLRYEKSLLMNEALRTVNSRGVAVAKADIHRAVKEGNWEKLKALYALAENDPRLGSPNVKPQTFDYHEFRLATVPATPGGPARATLTRFSEWKRLEITLTPDDSGFLEITGDMPYTLSHALYGVPGLIPGQEAQPDAETVEIWNQMVACAADALGDPRIGWNVLPETIQYADSGEHLTPRDLFDRNAADQQTGGQDEG